MGVRANWQHATSFDGVQPLERDFADEYGTALAEDEHGIVTGGDGGTVTIIYGTADDLREWAKRIQQAVDNMLDDALDERQQALNALEANGDVIMPAEVRA